MLALFDAYDDATKELLQSLAAAGIPVTPVVIRYDGDLPGGALCPFAMYTGLVLEGDPLFFDEVPIPPWCEIRQGRESYGQVLRDGMPLARINYEANSFRQVESVDWLLPDRTLGHTDHYDRHGHHYATTHYDLGVACQTVHRGPGEWEIEVDHASGVVTMRSPRSVLTFEDLTGFVSHFLDEQGLDEHGLGGQEPDGKGVNEADGILINSLSSPLFVARERAVTPNTTLFWQEPLPGDAPGNMVAELEEPTALERIVFFDETMRRRVADRYPQTPVSLVYLSHLGQFAPRRGAEALRTFTLTTSDELPGLEQLLAEFPQVTFSVAAPTLMSEKLHELARAHPNLTLKPVITHRGIRDELERASVYLDLNAGPHVLDVVKAAYYLNLVVLALEPVAKAPDHSLVVGTAQELAAQLSAVVAGPDGRARALDVLHTLHGPLSTPEDYLRVLA